MEYNCEDCKYFDTPALSEPCVSCIPYADNDDCKYVPLNSSNTVDTLPISGVNLGGKPIDTNPYSVDVPTSVSIFDNIKSLLNTLGFTMTYPETDSYTSFSKSFMDIVSKLCNTYNRVLGVSEEEMVELTHNGDWKPEGIPVDIADIIILLIKICIDNGIDIDSAISEKLGYIASLNSNDNNE